MACGVEGLLFRVYICSHCSKEDLFVDVCHMPGESEEGYHRRKEDLEQLIEQIPKGDADVVLAERPMHHA